MRHREPATRPLTQGDLPWVLQLSRARRQRLVPHAPRFWRPSQDADEWLSRWLGFQIGSEDTLSVRTASGFLFGVDHDGTQLTVDDMTVETPDSWPSDGLVLLREATGAGRPVRFVCPVVEPERSEVAQALGFVVTETWWHLDLRDSLGPSSDFEDVSVDGAEGRLVPAPPVYDPGGPVLLVRRADGELPLSRIEEKAARSGAAVSVVSQSPSNVKLGEMLTERGYIKTTDFYSTP